MKKVILFSRKTIPALIGEIFSEEERTLSAIYEGILRAIAGGKVVSGGIANYLFSRKLIKKDDPSLIQQHLLTLVKLGILKKIQIFNKNRFVYKHSSPLVRLFYLADEKYNIVEREPHEKELTEIIENNFSKLVEDSVREFLARKFGLIEAVAEGKDFEVDACLLKFRKLEVVVEVKWKRQFKKEDIIKAKNNLEKLKSKRKILFIPDKKQVLKFKKELKNIEIMDVEDL